MSKSRMAIKRCTKCKRHFLIDIEDAKGSYICDSLQCFLMGLSEKDRSGCYIIKGWDKVVDSMLPEDIKKERNKRMYPKKNDYRCDVCDDMFISTDSLEGTHNVLCEVCKVFQEGE